MKIDFRTEYQTIAVISFALTFIIYLLISQSIDSHTLALSGTLAKFLVSLGLYLLVFRSLLLLYNKWLWKHLWHKAISISGFWCYTIYKSTSHSNVKGYAFVVQDLYDLYIYGFNVGSGGSIQSIGFWHSENAYIAERTLYYDYEVIGERPNRINRIVRGRTTVNLFGSPPTQMVGSYIDLPLSSCTPTHDGNFVGSIRFERCSENELSDEVKRLFNEADKQPPASAPPQSATS